jgi:hypothetical protein
MTGDEVRQVCETILPQEEIDRLCEPFGVIERQRKLNLGMFVRAMVILAGTPGGAYQADALRSSLECEVSSMARSACYRWFDEPLERFMAALADRALAYAQAAAGRSAGPPQRGAGLGPRRFHRGHGPRRPARGVSRDRGRRGDHGA